MAILQSRRWRYIAVSAVCAGLNNVILIAGAYAGLMLVASVALSFACVVVVGYLGHARLTFAQPWGLAAFFRYALAMAANLPIFTAILAGLRWVQTPMLVAAPLATVAMLALNYALAKWAVGGGPRRTATGDA